MSAVSILVLYYVLIVCKKRLEWIDHNVGRGSHYVECILLGSEGASVSPFKILGVFAT